MTLKQHVTKTSGGFYEPEQSRPGPEEPARRPGWWSARRWPTEARSADPAARAEARSAWTGWSARRAAEVTASSKERPPVSAGGFFMSWLFPHSGRSACAL